MKDRRVFRPGLRSIGGAVSVLLTLGLTCGCTRSTHPPVIPPTTSTVPAPDVVIIVDYTITDAFPPQRPETIAQTVHAVSCLAWVLNPISEQPVADVELHLRVRAAAATDATKTITAMHLSKETIRTTSLTSYTKVPTSRQLAQPYRCTV